MLTPTLSKPKNAFRQQVLTTINQGIRHHEPFEALSAELINDIANKLLLIDDYEMRKMNLISLMKQIEEAQKIRRFNMMYENPDYNKQFSAALAFLSSQFKLRFSKYI